MPTAPSCRTTASAPATCSCAARGSCARYYQDEGGDPLTADGWLPTGDVGTIDADGYLQITDRTKDMIKSGGEWISSIELENIAIGHPAVAEAAVIGVPHPHWNERPLLVVVKRAGAERRARGAARVLRGQGREVVRVPTTSCSSTSCRTPRPASCRSARCASASATTCCRAERQRASDLRLGEVAHERVARRRRHRIDRRAIVRMVDADGERHAVLERRRSSPA